MYAAAIAGQVSSSDGWTHAAAILTGLAAVATFVLAWFTWGLARETKDVAETTRDEAAAVALQAKIANDLLDAARDERDDRRKRERSEQARLVGGYLAWSDRLMSSGKRRLLLHLVNASPLPVRRVIGHVYDVETAELVHQFSEKSVLEPSTPASPEWVFSHDLPAGGTQFGLQLDFDDDSGVHWRKYESDDKPIRELADDELLPTD
jgi:hypothetical protein